jgi:hypothetical protein
MKLVIEIYLDEKNPKLKKVLRNVRRNYGCYSGEELRKSFLHQKLARIRADETGRPYRTPRVLNPDAVVDRMLCIENSKELAAVVAKLGGFMREPKLEEIGGPGAFDFEPLLRNEQQKNWLLKRELAALKPIEGEA